MTLDAGLDYGHSAAELSLELNLRIKPPLVGMRATADTIKARYMKSGFTDVFKAVLLAYCGREGQRTIRKFSD